MTSEKRPAISAVSLPDGIHVVESFHRFKPIRSCAFFPPLRLFIKSDCMLFSFCFFLMLQQTDHTIRYAIMKWQNPQTLQRLKSENFFFYKIENMIFFFLNDKHHKERAKKQGMWWVFLTFFSLMWQKLYVHWQHNLKDSHNVHIITYIDITHWSRWGEWHERMLASDWPSEFSSPGCAWVMRGSPEGFQSFIMLTMGTGSTWWSLAWSLSTASLTQSGRKLPLKPTNANLSAEKRKNNTYIYMKWNP